jgi:hypothetical protein
VDYPSLMSAARSLGMEGAFVRDEDKAVVRAVFNLPVRLENTRRLAGKLRKLEFARDALGGRRRRPDRPHEGDRRREPGGHHRRVENPILDISSLLSSANGQGPQAVGVGLKEYMTHLAENQRDVVGVRSGLQDVRHAIGGGFRPAR